jgi:hypothetical protein
VSLGSAFEYHQADPDAESTFRSVERTPSLPIITSVSDPALGSRRGRCQRR